MTASQRKKITRNELMHERMNAALIDGEIVEATVRAMMTGTTNDMTIATGIVVPLAQGAGIHTSDTDIGTNKAVASEIVVHDDESIMLMLKFKASHSHSIRRTQHAACQCSMHCLVVSPFRSSNRSTSERGSRISGHRTGQCVRRLATLSSSNLENHL